MLFSFAFYFSAVFSFSFLLGKCRKIIILVRPIGLLGSDWCLAVGLRALGLVADALTLGFALLRRLIADFRIRVDLLVEVPLVRVQCRRFSRLSLLFLDAGALARALARALEIALALARALARALEITLALARALACALEIALLRRLVAGLRILVDLLVGVPLFRVRFRRFFRLILLRRWLMVVLVWSLPSLLGERALLLSPAFLAMPGECVSGFGLSL